MGTVHNITEARDRRNRRIAKRFTDSITDNIEAMVRALYRIPSPDTHWYHHCDHIKSSGFLPRGEPCFWCKASDTDTPGGAA